MIGDVYRLVYLAEFNRDILQISEYIARESQNSEFAYLFIGKLTKEADKLSYLAAAARPPFITLNGIKLYRYNIKHYAVFYTIDGDTVYVRRIIHSSRDLRKALRRSTVIQCL